MSGWGLHVSLAHGNWVEYLVEHIGINMVVVFRRVTNNGEEGAVLIVCEKVKSHSLSTMPTWQFASTACWRRVSTRCVWPRMASHSCSNA